MAYLSQVDTSTLAAQNLNTALLVHTFTNTTRLRQLWIDIFLTGIVGNGDYTAYITRQRAGAGVFYESLKTTKTAGVGIVSIMFNTIPLTINSTDVVKVYVLGLAGDNVNAVGVITEVNEEWVNIDASGRVDLGAWLGTAPAVLTASGYLQSMLLRWITDNAAGTPLALSANKVQSVDSTVPSANSVADQVWDEALALHLGAGSTGAALNGLAPGAPINLTVDETDIVVNP